MFKKYSCLLLAVFAGGMISGNRNPSSGYLLDTSKLVRQTKRQKKNRGIIGTMIK